MAGPFINLTSISSLQSGWNSQADQNFSLLLNFIGRSPLPARRVYWAAANQPSSGGDSSPFTSKLRDFPPALFQGCLVWIMDPASVKIGGVNTDSGDANKFAFCDGSNWYWQANVAAGPLDAAT